MAVLLFLLLIFTFFFFFKPNASVYTLLLRPFTYLHRYYLQHVALNWPAQSTVLNLHQSDDPLYCISLCYCMNKL